MNAIAGELPTIAAHPFPAVKQVEVGVLNVG